MTPTRNRSAATGSCTSALRWATRKTHRSPRPASSMAARDAVRPTSSGTTIYGNTTRSRSGRTGGRSGTSYESASRVTRGMGRESKGEGGVDANKRWKSAEGAGTALKNQRAPTPPSAFPAPLALFQRHLRFLLLPLRRDLEQRGRAVEHARLGDLHLHHVIARRELEHDVGHELLEDRAEAACSGAALERLAGDAAERRFLEGQLHVLEVEQLLVLLGERVLRLLENPDERFLIERVERDAHRQTSHQLGDESVTQEIVRLDLGKRALLGLVRPAAQDLFLREADLPASGACLDDLVETVERAPADEQDVLGVDLDVFLLRVLASTLRWYRSDGAFEDLEQRLLHALARDVARDAGVFRLARDLVDLVDVDDAALALGDVELAGLEQPDENVLDVFADVPRFGERRGVGDGEGDVENARERLCEERLACSGRPDEEDVRLVELHLVVA